MYYDVPIVFGFSHLRNMETKIVQKKLIICGISVSFIHLVVIIGISDLLYNHTRSSWSYLSCSFV
jgi:hypothetical protein